MATAVAKAERLAHAYRTLLEVSVELAEEDDPVRLCQVATDAVLEITGAARGFVALVDGDGFRFPVARRTDAADIADPDSEASRTVMRRVIESGESEVVVDAVNDPRYRGARSVHNLQLRAVLCAPLTHRGRAVGAFYLDGPSDCFGRQEEELVGGLGRALGAALERERSRARLSEDRERLLAELKGRDGADGIVGRSPALVDVLRMIAQVADTPASVLITGESGTGKEMVARALHRNSSRAEGPFVAVNCGAIPRELLEGELFGYERGAFTGAVRSRPGRFEAADGGTLFLDEIGELEPELQVKLLRAIQTREIVRLGSNESRKIDARLLSATNRDLAEEVRAGRFRRDLYYRIRVIEVHLPPLRERVEDIAALADALLQRLADRYGGEPAGITPAALAAIEAYDWPGNVRELENVLERGWILAHGQPLDLNHLPPELRGGVPAPEIPSGLPLEEATDRFRRYYIVRALDAAEGNKTRAADALGVNRSYLFTLLKRYGLSS
ncbi:sigma-54-dependent Fis family transcriptional regulator [Myxococcota bacterium]|nr:sigma-54-dependent Fis family transcriptional regulator [Myxococcota bacterium]